MEGRHNDDMELPKWAVGEIVVTIERNEKTQEDEFVVFNVVGYDEGVPVCEKLAVCDMQEKAELVGSLLKVYAASGKRLPTCQDLLEKN